MIDKETFNYSSEMVCDVVQDSWDYLFGDLKKWREKGDMLEAIDSAIQEMQSWKKHISENQGGAN